MDQGPPPPPPEADRVKRGEEQCYPEDDAIAIALWANSIWRWAQDAYALCGPKDKK